MSIRKVVSTIALSALVFFPLVSKADDVTVTFSGVVQSGSVLGLSGLTIGQGYTASITYDTDSSPVFQTTGRSNYLGNTFEFNSGSQHYSDSSAELDVYNDYNYGGTVMDAFQVWSSFNGYSVDLLLQDDTANTLSSTLLPNADYFDAFPASNGNYLRFFRATGGYDNTTGKFQTDLSFSIDTIQVTQTPVATPEPSSLLLLGTGLLGGLGTTRRKLSKMIRRQSES